VLGRSPHFRALPPAALDRLAAMARIQRFEDEALVHAAWQPMTDIWIVLRGGVRIALPTGEGTVVPVTLASEGTHYGVSALVTRVESETEARSVGVTDLARIDLQRLREAFRHDRVLKDHIMGLLGTRLRSYVGLYRDVISAPLAKRMARRLLSHAMSAGRERTGCADIELRLSQGDFAEMLGASRSRVNAELRRLERRGTIKLGYRSIVVCDLARLRADSGVRVVAI